MSLPTILPMAVVMVAGSQLVAAVFLASGDRPRRASLGFLTGAAIVVAAGTTIAWLVTRGVKGGAGGGGGDGRSPIETKIDWAVLALLVVLAVVVFLRRHSTDEPRWMGRLQHAGFGYALKLGLVLFVAMPADDITMAAVGASAARHDLPWWHLLPFILLTLLLLAFPCSPCCCSGGGPRGCCRGSGTGPTTTPGSSARSWSSSSSW
ncbi:GAP family protein [Micromonospora sp. DT47]